MFSNSFNNFICCKYVIYTIFVIYFTVHENVKDNVSPAEDGCGKYLTDTTRGGEQSLESKEDREAAPELSERPGK